jgi:hypothetical protein
VAGCTQKNVASAIGLERQAPDEFQVVRRAPLELPPNYNLRPPAPGAPRPQEGTPSQGARAALVGSVPAVASGSAGAPAPGTGEGALVASLAGGQTDPEIRTLLAAESAQLDRGDSRFLFGDFFNVLDSSTPGTPIDATDEAARLRQEGVVPLRRPTLSASAPVPVEPGASESPPSRLSIRTGSGPL